MSNTAPKAEIINIKDYVSYADGSIVSKILLKKGVNNITLFSFDKGQSLSEHTVPFDAFVEIIDGRAQITIDGEAKDVSSGEIIIMPANIAHSVKAHERFKMILTMLKE